MSIGSYITEINPVTLARLCASPECTHIAVGKYARFCAQCQAGLRRKPMKYLFTRQIDAKIEAIYKNPDQRTHLTATQYAKQLGWPKHVVIARARKLGLSRKYGPERAWTDAEVELLTANAWKCDDRIAAIFQKNGFQRSRTSIHLKLKRLQLFKRDQTEHYSATALAKAFGCDSHQITRWINTGLLRASRRGTERIDSQGGDMWTIHQKNIREFVIQNPLGFDLRKVEPLWFIDLLTNTKGL